MCPQRCIHRYKDQDPSTKLGLLGSEDSTLSSSAPDLPLKYSDKVVRKASLAYVAQVVGTKEPGTFRQFVSTGDPDGSCVFACVCAV